MLFRSICYSDQFCTAFSLQSSSRNIYTSSYIMWYSPKGNREVAFEVNGKLNSVIRTPRVNFRGDTTNNALLTVTEEGGSGFIDTPMINNPANIQDTTYEEYLRGDIVTPNPLNK